MLSSTEAKSLSPNLQPTWYSAPKPIDLSYSYEVAVKQLAAELRKDADEVVFLEGSNPIAIMGIGEATTPEMVMHLIKDCTAQGIPCFPYNLGSTFVAIPTDLTG